MTRRDTSSHSVLVAGAGLGGLTAAALLARAKRPVTVLEQAIAPADTGAGIQLGPNAMHVLDSIGLASSLARVAVKPGRALLKAFDTGRPLLVTPLNPDSDLRFGQPYLQVHRADLHALLLQAAERSGARIEFATPITSINNAADGVTVETERGTHSADTLIGADGIHSVVRSSVLDHREAGFTGQTAYRALIPVEGLPVGALSKDAHVWMGSGKHIVAYYVRGGELINLVAVSERAHWRDEGWQLPADANELRALFADWDPVVCQLLDGVSTCYHWGLFDRPVPAIWHRQRVALLGDACHPMLPFMAQGAAMAIEDAWVLADELARGRSVSSAFTRYQMRRRPRVAHVHRQSRRNAQTYHRRPGARSRLRNGAFALATRFPALSRKALDPIYGVNVTQE